MNSTSVDIEYIEQCMEKYTDSMIRAAYSILGSLTESEDAVQDTLNDSLIKLHGCPWSLIIFLPKVSFSAINNVE